MRILLAFVTVVAGIITLNAMADGDWTMVAVTGAVTAVAAALLWRNLRDPAVTRAMGLQCQVHFIMNQSDTPLNHGTRARVTPLRKTFGDGWIATLDRVPERQDLTLIDTAQRGWVWLGDDDLPAKVKIDYGATWKTWNVTHAQPAT